MRQFTEEQQAIVSGVGTYRRLGAEAHAGAGKTTVLTGIAEANPGARITACCFGREMARQLEAKMPKGRLVTCTTMHSMAWKTVGFRYQDRLDAKTKITNAKLAAYLDIHSGIEIKGPLGDRLPVAPPALAWLAMETVTRWTQSADLVISGAHMPRPVWCPSSQREELAAAIEPHARMVVRDLASIDGRLPFSHDHYLKFFQLLDPVIGCDILLVDEAQDLNPLQLVIVESQGARANAPQITVVGDHNQRIFEWRGAVSALSDFEADKTLYLSQSFRFGPQVEPVANLVLDALGSTAPPLRGTPSLSTEVVLRGEPTHVATTLLCRTNGTALGAMLGAQGYGQKVHYIGSGAKDMLNFAFACGRVMKGDPANHPWLNGFANWSAVIRHCKNTDAMDPADRELAGAVGIVLRHGVGNVINGLRAAVPSKEADLRVGTAHGAKGLEFPSVELADDFPATREVLERDEEGLRIIYVALTRAQEVLDLRNATGTLRAAAEIAASRRRGQECDGIEDGAF